METLMDEVSKPSLQIDLADDPDPTMSVSHLNHQQQ